jgi:hypothetical protein
MAAEGGWTPTVASYLGRVTKAQILAAVSEAKGEAAAEGIAQLEKADMAEAAERLLEGAGWLPAPLRTPGLERSNPRAFETTPTALRPSITICRTPGLLAVAPALPSPALSKLCRTVALSPAAAARRSPTRSPVLRRTGRPSSLPPIALLNDLGAGPIARYR